MSIIHIQRMLMGLVLLGPALAWAQPTHDGENLSADPQLKWVRSLRPVIQSPFDVSTVSPNQQPTKNPDHTTGSGSANPSSAYSTKDLTPQKWSILLSDKTLYRTMRRWSQEAKYQLLWQIDRDYPIEAEVVFDNTLRGAVAQVMAGVALTDYPLQAIFNPTTRVVRVVRHLAESGR